jgi:hypothetical protein
MPKDALNRIIVALLHFERRFDPFFRPAFDAVLREPMAAVIRALINLQRHDEGLRLAEEKLMPGEEDYLDQIIETMATYMNTHYKPGGYQRAGNTKTHGILRGEVIIREDLPTDFRRGVFAETRKFLRGYDFPARRAVRIRLRHRPIRPQIVFRALLDPESNLLAPGVQVGELLDWTADQRPVPAADWISDRNRRRGVPRVGYRQKLAHFRLAFA